jgi:hypothetical protein
VKKARKINDKMRIIIVYYLCINLIILAHCRLVPIGAVGYHKPVLTYKRLMALSIILAYCRLVPIGAVGYHKPVLT